MKIVLALVSVVLGSTIWALSAEAATKRIGILVFDGVLTSDITAPIEVFGAASRKSWFNDYEVVTIGVVSNAGNAAQASTRGVGKASRYASHTNSSKATTEIQTITTEEGLVIRVDYSLEDAPKLDVLIIPSAYDMAPLLNNVVLIKFVKTIGAQVEWLASNCSGAFVLGKAGLLDGRKATTWAGGEQELKSTFPKIDVQMDRNVVIDGNVLTSNGSLVSYQAALILLSRMASTSKAEEVAEALQYSRVFQPSLLL